MSSETYTYAAFISYKHHSSPELVRELELALKNYAKPRFRKPLRIFRDELHMVPGIDLPQLVRDALEVSEYLILLASPEAAASPWVQQELDYWCRTLKRTGNLIIVLVDGRIVRSEHGFSIDWDATTALPSLLREHLATMPLYVDMTWAAGGAALGRENPLFMQAVNAISARLRRIDPNEMLGIEIRQYRRNIRNRNIAAALLLLLLVASVAAAVVAHRQTNVAEGRRRAAVMRAATESLGEGRAQEALELASAEPLIPAAFVRSLELARFERQVIVEAGKLSDPETFDVNELMLSRNGSILVSQGWYAGVNVIDLSRDNHRIYCGEDTRFKSVSLSPDGTALVLLDERGVEFRARERCTEGTRLLARPPNEFTAAAALDGPQSLLTAGGGLLFELRARFKNQAASPLFLDPEEKAVRAIFPAEGQELIALLIEGGVLRLLRQYSDGLDDPVAADLRIPSGDPITVRDEPWIRFVQSLPPPERVKMVVPRIGANGSSTVLAFWLAPSRELVVAREETAASTTIMAARVTSDPADGCTRLEWITPSALHRVVLPECSTAGERRETVPLPAVGLSGGEGQPGMNASAGAFCPDADTFVVGTSDGAMVWLRYVGHPGTPFIVEHVERAWPDSVTALACRWDHTVYAGFRKTGIKKYQSHLAVKTAFIATTTAGQDARLLEDREWTFRLAGQTAMLRVAKAKGQLRVEAPDTAAWVVQVAKTTEYRTGSLVDSIDAVAIDETRDRVWCLTSLGKLLLLDAHTGAIIAVHGTVYYAAGGGMNITFSGLNVDAASGDVSFTYAAGGSAWTVKVTAR